MSTNSQARTLYSNLAARIITYTKEAGGSQAVTALDLHQLKVVQDADAPVRLILPYSTYTEQRTGLFATLGPSTFGPLRKHTFWICDLFLLKRGALGNLYESAPDLVRYQGAYNDNMATFRDFGTATNGTTLDEWRFIPGIWDWPINDEDGQWHAVMTILTVTERLTGTPT